MVMEYYSAMNISGIIAVRGEKWITMVNTNRNYNNFDIEERLIKEAPPPKRTRWNKYSERR